MGKGYFRSLRRRVKARLFHHDASDPGRAASEATDHTSAAIQASSYGVLVWHDCPHATVDICFVHGLTGDRERSWTAADSKKEKDGHPWPQSILPPELPNARILTYGYDAYYTSEGVSSGNRLSDHARNLVTELTTNRRANQNRPLIFVAHSLGGLVTKKGLLLSRDNREEYLQGIFKCTKGIIFMGTPHRGSWMADWAKFPVSAFGVVKSVNGRLLKSLQTDGEYLESMQEDFARLLRKTDTKSETPIEVTCFFEELPMQVIGTIVSRESATLPDYNAISIHANHREMVRFSSTTDRGFVEVLGLLRKWQYEVELGPLMRSVFFEMRQLVDMFEECRGYLHGSPNAEQHLFSFNKTLLHLGSCKLRTEETYTRILQGACIPKIESLMKRDAGWQDLQLQSKLRSSLQDDWVDFRKTVEGLEQNLSYFKRKLSINTTDKENDWEDLIHDFLEKWAASQSSATTSMMYERLVGKIVRAVDRLCSFAPNTVGETQEAEAVSGKGSSERVEWVASWLSVREHTRNIWDKLSHIWSYNCPMQQHQANIQLCPPGVPISHQQISFGYSFSLHTPLSGCAWRDVIVTSKNKMEKDLPLTRRDEKGKKRARFVDVGVTINELTSLPKHNLEGEVFNICQTIERQYEQGDKIGSLACGDCDYIMYGDAPGDRELVPLRNILPYFHNGQPIPTAQRRKISLCLASSLLMLYNTPWLPEYWSLDDVYMDRSDPTRLYRKQVFSKHSPVPSQPKPDDTDVIDNEPIFCLAVALLELTFGAPLTNFYNSNCGIAGPNTNSTGLGAADPVAGPDNRLLRLITAKRLTKAIRKHEEERFASVVIKCMNPPSSSPTEYDFSFQSEAFRKQFIQDVVVPLWRDVVSLRE